MRFSTNLLLIVHLAVMPRPAEAKNVSAPEKEAAISRGKVWFPTDVETMDTLNGPQGPDGYPYKAGQSVSCRYEEKDPLKPLGGHSPKFPCWTPEKERLKVKYNATKNPEIYGEVAATRLFWALGFPAERMYSVKVVCDNCPEDPWTSTAASPRAKRTFEPVSVQKRLKGTELSPSEGEGWEFSDLELINEKAGGSNPAEVDALRLLSVFVNHGDNTPNQQRILCAESDPACAHPLVYVTDLGATFGGKDYYTSYRAWAKKKSIWKDPAQCIADFKGTTDAMVDPKISEAGRKFLADLLSKLSDKQIRDLFVGARFDDLGKHEYPIREKGRARPVTVDDWVKVFKVRRAQILEARCPS